MQVIGIQEHLQKSRAGMPNSCKQGRDDIKVKVVYKASSLHLFHTSVQCRAKKDVGMGLCILPSLLVCIVVGILSLFLHTFLKCFCDSLCNHTPEQFPSWLQSMHVALFPDFMIPRVHRATEGGERACKFS